MSRLSAKHAGAAAAVLAVLALVLAATLVLRREGDDPVQQPAAPSTRQAPSDVLVVAHRGASAYAPHNTVAAAREAVARGADAVEADIRQTQDGHLVALFRSSLAPTTNVEQVFPDRRPWQIEMFTLAEVRRLDSGSWFAPEFAGERVPTLEELVAALDGTDVELIVEVKTPRRYPGIRQRLLDRIEREPDRFREVESFDLDFLRRLDRHEPPVRLGAAAGVPPERMAEVASYLDALNAPRHRVDEAYVRRAHGLGFEVKVWSLNTPPAVREAFGLGVDGVYSHRPDLVRRLGRKALDGR